jgi:predicted DsbA family dithiol-disulfide isomerase
VSRSFAVTWDYRCPFARNAHEHLLDGLESGADWDVRFLAFSLDAPSSESSVWESIQGHPGMLANLAGIVVRDREPEHFSRVHRALFSARHDLSLDLRDRDVLAKVLGDAGVDGTWVLSEIDTGWPLEVHQAEHTDAAERLEVFGVPTFVVGDRAVFVRLMDRPGSSEDPPSATIERVLDLVDGWPGLNEFKYTTLAR